MTESGVSEAASSGDEASGGMNDSRQGSINLHKQYSKK